MVIAVLDGFMLWGSEFDGAVNWSVHRVEGCYLYSPLLLAFAFLPTNLHSQHSPPLHHPSLFTLSQPFNSSLSNHINYVFFVKPAGKCPLSGLCLI